MKKNIWITVLATCLGMGLPASIALADCCKDKPAEDGVCDEGCNSETTKVWGKFVNDGAMGEKALGLTTLQLEVPNKGQGDVFLRFRKGGHKHEFKASKFYSFNLGNETRFHIIFRDLPDAPPGSFVAMLGTYNRGSNAMLYAGNAYMKICESCKPPEEGGDDAEAESVMNQMLRQLGQMETVTPTAEGDDSEEAPPERPTFIGSFSFFKKI
jgi:hypothetical protein